ncbi:hypothetical protein [Ottowia thiooxydans]|uniref:hypothetical protein n=1 Tax=Ottowia thiooxydans TaxID=219182 RepID=UPI000411752B|nr:hypothetical protein [Ottowia thiooxydans]
MRALLFCSALMLASLANAQPAADVWSNVPQASDDRFTNPKSKLYAGPNGWYNFGELRAEAGAKRYAQKAGLNYLATPQAFVLASSNQLQVLTLDFGTPRPAAGVYQLAAKPDAAGRKVRVVYADVANQKILEWSSNHATGSVTVAQANGFVHFTARNLKLTPSGLHNAGDTKQPLVLGLEGATKLD